MKRIEHFMMPEHHNELYTKEAGSSIALTREAANKINEMIDMLNSFESVDLAWKQEQDGRIRKAIIYMKDNLANTMSDLMVLLRDSGFIEDRIQYYCNHLSERLDNLLTAVPADGELLDIRTGSGGSIYRTAGEAVRTELNQLREYIHTAVNLQQLDIGPVEVGYIGSTGENYESLVTLRTKDFLALSGPELFLVNPDPEKQNIRIFRYSPDGTFEKEYTNSGYYRLDAGKKYKMSFTYDSQENMKPGDISRFNLLHYKHSAELSPEMFGGKANDETHNNEPAFYLMIEYAKAVSPLVDFEGRPVYDFGDLKFNFSGTYHINSSVTFPDMLNGIFDGLKLKWTGTEDSYLLNLGYSRDCRFGNMILDGNYKASCILLRDGYSNLSIKDSVICHFTYYGVRTSGHGGHELNIVGNKIFQTEYQNFERMLADHNTGCAIILTDGHTDNLIADNIICYTFGERQIQINSGSLLCNGNHFYNAAHGELFIYGTNHVFTGNFFDCITVNDSRGGNLFTGNTFMSTEEYLCPLMKFDTKNYFGRKTMFNNNMMKAPAGYHFDGEDANCIIGENMEIEV